jgi:hypothetical protein
MAALDIVGTNFSFARTIGATQNGNYVDCLDFQPGVQSRSLSVYPNLSQRVNLPAQIIHSLPTAVEDLVNC